MTRCAVCGRKLTNPKSVVKGIGPICLQKLEKNDVEFKVRDMLKGLRLPCYLEPNLKYCKDCIYKNDKSCPRERIYLRKDVYPLRERKVRRCTFCGKQLNQYNYRKYVFKNRVTLECDSCFLKNREWRMAASAKQKAKMGVL